MNTMSKVPPFCDAQQGSSATHEESCRPGAWTHGHNSQGVLYSLDKALCRLHNKRQRPTIFPPMADLGTQQLEIWQGRLNRFINFGAQLASSSAARIHGGKEYGSGVFLGPGWAHELFPRYWYWRLCTSAPLHPRACDLSLAAAEPPNCFTNPEERTLSVGY